MPLYEFKCTKCEEIIEQERKMEHRDDLLFHQPPCNGEMVRLLTIRGIHLKGAGFYRTDETGIGAC